MQMIIYRLLTMRSDSAPFQWASRISPSERCISVIMAKIQ